MYAKNKLLGELLANLSLNTGYFSSFAILEHNITLESQMINRHNKTLILTEVDLDDYFQRPASPRQKQYEAIRAIAVDGKSIEDAAKRYGYKASTVYSMLRDAKAGKIETQNQ